MISDGFILKEKTEILKYILTDIRLISKFIQLLTQISCLIDSDNSILPILLVGMQ